MMPSAKRPSPETSTGQLRAVESPNQHTKWTSLLSAVPTLKNFITAIENGPIQDASRDLSGAALHPGPGMAFILAYKRECGPGGAGVGGVRPGIWDGAQLGSRPKASAVSRAE